MEYTTMNGIKIIRNDKKVDFENQKMKIINDLNIYKGAYLCSSFEYPGRYTRWDMGFINPPIEIRSKDKHFTINALNERGEILITIISMHLSKSDVYKTLNCSISIIEGEILTTDE